MHYAVISKEGLRKTITFSVARVPAEVRTNHLPNISVELYYADVASFRILF